MFIRLVERNMGKGNLSFYLGQKNGGFLFQNGRFFPIDFFQLPVGRDSGG